MEIVKVKRKGKTEVWKGRVTLEEYYVSGPLLINAIVFGTWSHENWEKRWGI